MSSTPQTGTLVMVVGPSGAGKDTLIDYARGAFKGDADVVFARRVVTRAALKGAEDHDTLSEAEFSEAERAGGFLLSWRSHGLGYGLPGALRDELAAGRVVVANVSRAVIPQTASFPCRRLVVNVIASPEILARRLGARGRESAADIAGRLSRSVAIVPAGAEIAEIRNEGTPEEGGERLVALLRGVRSA